jgi:TetR/AcrR family transcriptional regulator
MAFIRVPRRGALMSEPYLTPVSSSGKLITNQSVIKIVSPVAFMSAALHASTMPAQASAPKRERRKEARPGELLAAALDLFVEKGFAATRAEEVAQRAGVSKGTLFLYFGSKEELFKAVVRENISGHYPGWHEKLQLFEGSTADMLHLCAQGWWDNIGATKACGISKLMLAEGGNFPDLQRFYEAEVIEPGNQLLHRILERGVKRGEFRADLNLMDLVHLFVAPFLYLMVCKLGGLTDGPAMRIDPQRFLATQVDVFLGGIATGQVLKKEDAQ